MTLLFDKEKETILNTIKLIKEGEHKAEFENSIDFGDDGDLFVNTEKQNTENVRKLGGFTKPIRRSLESKEDFILQGFSMIPGVLEETFLPEKPKKGERIDSDNRTNTIRAWDKLNVPTFSTDFTIISVEGGDDIENQDFTGRYSGSKKSFYCTVFQTNFTYNNKNTRSYLLGYKIRKTGKISAEESEDEGPNFLDHDTVHFQICDLKETIIPGLYGLVSSYIEGDEKIVVRFKSITMNIENNYGLCPLNHFYDSIQNYRKTSYSSISAENVTHFFKNLNRMLFDIYSCWLILRYYALIKKFDVLEGSKLTRGDLLSLQVRRDMRKILWPNLQRHIIKLLKTTPGKKEFKNYVTTLDSEQMEEFIQMINEPQLDWTKHYSYYVYKDKFGNEQIYNHNGIRNRIFIDYLLPRLEQIVSELREERTTGCSYSDYLRRESESLEMYSIIAGSGETYDPNNFIGVYTEVFREYRLYYMQNKYTGSDIPEDIKAKFPLKFCLWPVASLSYVLQIRPEENSKDVEVNDFNALFFSYLNQRMVCFISPIKTYNNIGHEIQRE